MSFQIHALPREEFTELFAMTDAQLAERNACRLVVAAKPGTPCRVSLEDAEIGETVILLHYHHQRANSPYRASHAIFVRENAQQAQPAPGEVPQTLQERLISLRVFDEKGMMIDADVVEGTELGARIPQAFADENTAYIHLHNAKPGCFHASVTRID